MIPLILPINRDSSQFREESESHFTPQVESYSGIVDDEDNIDSQPDEEVGVPPADLARFRDLVRQKKAEFRSLYGKSFCRKKGTSCADGIKSSNPIDFYPVCGENKKCDGWRKKWKAWKTTQGGLKGLKALAKTSGTLNKAANIIYISPRINNGVVTDLNTIEVAITDNAAFLALKPKSKLYLHHPNYSKTTAYDVVGTFDRAGNAGGNIFLSVKFKDVGTKNSGGLPIDNSSGTISDVAGVADALPPMPPVTTTTTTGDKDAGLDAGTGTIFTLKNVAIVGGVLVVLGIASYFIFFRKKVVVPPTV
jgi:hypothetical protein